MNDGILTCLAPAESCLRTVFLRLVPRFFWNLRILSLLRWRFSFFAFTRQASSSVVDTIFDCGTKAREGAKACQANKRSTNQQCVNNKKVQLKKKFYKWMHRGRCVCTFHVVSKQSWFKESKVLLWRLWVRHIHIIRYRWLSSVNHVDAATWPIINFRSKVITHSAWYD